MCNTPDNVPVTEPSAEEQFHRALVRLLGPAALASGHKTFYDVAREFFFEGVQVSGPGSAALPAVPVAWLRPRDESAPWDLEFTSADDPQGFAVVRQESSAKGPYSAAQVARMLHDFPRLSAFCEKHAIGPRMPPKCLLCQHPVLPAELGASCSLAYQHPELPGVVVCRQCHDAALAAPVVKDSI